MPATLTTERPDLTTRPDPRLIPARFAWVQWSAADRPPYAIRDLRVVDWRHHASPRREHMGGRDCDHGAAIWRNGLPQPEALWADLVWCGFADRREMFSALAQFGRIAECGWARRMTSEPLGWMIEPAALERERTLADRGLTFLQEFPPQPLLPTTSTLES